VPLIPSGPNIRCPRKVCHDTPETTSISWASTWWFGSE